jgi:hypothetical protein
MPPVCRFHELAMLCHEHANTSKLPYLDAEYSYQAEVEANSEKTMQRVKARQEKRAAAKARGALLNDSDTEDDESEEENPFFSGVFGSATTYEEDELAEYLQKKDHGENKRRKRPRLDYCLPVDFMDEVSSLGETLCRFA